ncbi:YccF domain-containing protein [Patulibacter americanus]|uniref:YccF domain-containing protein n=1 Tax=Patulibacter americanus TaxID=588672 RepID=UPI0003B67317|nr:YccF domain-containing protein [Patulibacter americanus]
MRLVLNVLWLVLAGFWMAVGYVAAGLLLLIPIVTIPFSLAAFRIAGFCLWPFGRTLVPARGAGVASGVGNVLWILLAGWWLALGHLITGVALCLTIIGIPFGIANFKLIPVSLVPLGSRVVPIGSAEDTAGVAF